MGIFDKIFKKDKPVENRAIVRNDAWNFYTYQYEDQGKTFKALIEFDDMHANETNHAILGSGLRLILYVSPEYCSENGLALRDVAMELLTIQKRLLAGIKSDSRLVGKMSYGYLVDMAFQTNNISQLKTELADIEINHRIIKKEFREYENWAFFDEKIKPDMFYKQKIADRNTIGQLIKAGSDQNAVHELEHFFIGEEERLQFVSEQLKPQGFELDYIKEGKMLLTQHLKLDLEEISKHTGKIKMFAEKVGIIYDGWGTKIVK
ncbi:MAG: hypothetical protein GQ574_26040 [Crocinitomix sp.]|nr:hypothetical protein [Crocinitomix sp.]